MPGRLPAQPQHHGPDTSRLRLGISQSRSTKMSECRSVGPTQCERCSIQRRPRKRLQEANDVCRLYCLPPLNGTLSRPGFSQSRPPLLNPPVVCACVFFPPLVSLVPNIFIDIFVCCSHLGPPCVNINLRRQPRPLIS